MTRQSETLLCGFFLRVLYFAFRAGLETLYAISASVTCIAIKGCRRIFSSITNMRLVGRAILRSRRLRRLDVGAKHLALTIYIPVDLTFSLGDYVQTSIYFEGYPAFLLELIYFADSRTLFFDIGANVGAFSVAMGKKTAPSLIHAFEPVQSTCERLQKNLDANCQGAHVHRVAVSARSGTLSLAVPEIDSGSASIDLSDKETVNLHGQRVRCRRCNVQTIAFDDFWTSEIEAKCISATKIAMKIDVEGHELQVLDGMQKFLKSHRKPMLIAIEVRNENLSVVNQIMANHGFFVVRPFYSDPADEAPHHRDILYANSESTLCSSQLLN